MKNKSLKIINTVARYTFLDIFYSKIMVGVLFSGVFLLVVCFVASEFTYGVPQKISLDIGVGLTTLVSVAISIFMGSSLITKEVDSRSLYMVLSKPVSRRDFIVGKILGLVAIIFLNVIFLAALTIIAYLFLGGANSELFYWTTLMIFFEALIMLLIVIFFSILTNQTLSVIFAITTYVSAHALSDTLMLRFAKTNILFNSILKLVKVLLPNLDKINLRDYLIYNQTLPIEYLTRGLAYSVCYSIMILIAIIIVFNRKNLD